ncbi:hypothetical protein C380_08830 [Acidovorax sp. KKS102]|uniref:hypothetical protein n=1 Tax=Acidovorax sp. KKS102 TaxID=358220 RepID=UPI00028B89B7|nr:hypothetical protein [Acidovorax sp. KKS102]AFU45468.1 hypothetical protein C380_08830 [Acidovorax sp. KKS102]
MLTFEKFSGINNVLASHRLGGSELAAATNVDAGLSGDLIRRVGYDEALDTCHKNLHQADGFMLATVDGGDLIAMDAAGGSRTTLYPSLGPSRVWYCNLPDGRTTFSNGLINGIASGSAATAWGVPIPADLGALTPLSGDLFPGDYQYQLTYVRLSDGLEGGPIYSNPTPVPDGGILLTGLPVLEGHKINVYLTSANGDQAYLAGSAFNDSFAYLGKNEALVLPCRTDFLQPMPVGTVTAFWRGRVLTAVGPVLYASKTNSWELCDMRRDFKQFSGDLTLIQPVDGGIFVGTTKELAFLAGTEFDKLAYTRVLDGPVVLGSGVAVRGELVQRGQGAGQGAAMVCIAGRGIVAGFSDGGISRMTEGRYATDVTEVAATFRMVGGAPQYLAVPQ